ncbi:MAG: ABC-2 family transporter protein, partial [Pseudomonadales bacterium]|nr:ABC-2 family transporter protein [Pseudomonadales bacterium]
VGGYTANEFAAYYITLMVVNHLTFSWIMQVFQFRIQFGSLSQELLRPIHPIHYDIADNIAYKIVQMIVLLPAMVFLIWYFEPAFNFEAGNVLIALPVIFLAFITRFLLEWTLALAAFWTTRLTAINNSYFAVMMFMSGRIAPIALLPFWLQTVAEKLPFYYVVAFPVEILTGKLAQTQIVEGIGMLCLWLGIATVLIRFVWSRALRSFSAVGS